MAIEEEILCYQLKYDVYNQDTKITGIAKQAIAKGLDSLSSAQKYVINPYLSQPCEGITDPGGNHNDCHTVLVGKELRDAYADSFGTGPLVCERCRDEANDIAAHKERFFRD